MKKIAGALVALLFASATTVEAWQNENTRKICEEMAAKIGVASEKMDDYMRACVDGKNPAGGRISGEESENGAGRGKSRRAAVSRSGKGVKAGKRGKVEKAASGKAGKSAKAGKQDAKGTAQKAGSQKTGSQKVVSQKADARKTASNKADAKAAPAKKDAKAAPGAATAKPSKPEVKATPAKATPANKPGAKDAKKKP